jgi:hypothetical protein
MQCHVSRARALAHEQGVQEIEADAPVIFIGTGSRLDDATASRAADLLGVSVPEVMNQATLAGAIEIGRHRCVVRVNVPRTAEASGCKGHRIVRKGIVQSLRSLRTESVTQD